MTPLTATSSPARRQGGCFTSLIFLLLFVAGTLVLYAIFLPTFSKLIESLRWVETPCRIVSSRLEQVRESPADKRESTRAKRDPAAPTTEPVAGQSVFYRADIRYSYYFNGELYRSTRIWFIKHDTETSGEAKAMVDRYPQGLETQCYVDPRDAKSAVLQRGFKPELLIAIVPLALAVIGLWGLLGQFIGAARRPTAETLVLPSLSIRRTLPTGAVTYTARRCYRSFISVILFTAIWNLIVANLVREVITNWRDGIPGCHGWLLTLFALPMVVIGVIFLALSIYYFLKLFSPLPTLTLSAGAVAIGSPLEFSWRFGGSVHRIRRLRIGLEGREEATYLRNDEPFTDREIFSNTTLLDTTRREEIHAGKTQFTIPVVAAPSFQSAHNRIAWTIRFCAELKRWPDIEEDFEFTALPSGDVATQSTQSAKL
jgi:hypothetical protein